MVLKETIKNVQQGKASWNNRFGTEHNTVDLGDFTGKNMNNLTGYEDYTNYEGKDYTGNNHSIEDLQRENRNKAVTNVIIKCIFPLLALLSIYYILKETVKKSKKQHIDDDKD